MPELGIGLGITKGAAPKAKLLLDKYDIDAAFSLRKVRAEYNGPCVRVRNSSGTLKDIGFLSNGSIDEAALNAHCGDNDGKVQTWYNQSAEGGQYNAVQDTTADQPIIYDASSGGYLGYVENTGNMYLRFENQLTGVTDAGVVYENTTVPGAVSGSAYVVGEHEVSATGGNGILVGHNSVNGFSFVPDSGLKIETHTGEGQNEKHAGFAYVGGSDKFAVVDGYVCGESSNAGSANFDYIFTKAKNDGDQDTFDFVGKVWEVFLSTSDLSANRIALENSILSANGLTVPEQTLLEKYDGAEGAFSTRCINREHVGPILRVRNEVDHALRVVVDQDNFGDTSSRLGITKTVPGVSNSDTPTCTFEIYADCPSVTGNVNISGQFGNSTTSTTPTSVPQNQWVSVSINTLSTPSGLFRVYFAGTTLQSLDSGDRIYFRNFDYDHPNGAGDTVSYDSDFSSNVDGFGKSGDETGDISLNGGLGSSPLRNIYLQSDGTLNTDYLETQCTLATDKFDGFVQTWFDQSSYGYDATNATTSQQPKIYDETDGVVLLDGKPAVEFDGSDDILESSSQTINTEAIIAVASTNNEATVAQHIIRQGTAYIRFDGSNKVEYRNNANLRDDTVNNCPGLVNDNAALVSWYTKGTSFNDANASWKWYFNGDLLGTETGDNLSSETGAIKIGAQTTTQELLNGKVCEAIIIDKRDAHYDSADQIHKDINAHYLIYQEATESPASGFLSDHSGAAAAYSVRQLGDANLCMRVRRDGDNAEKNIGFGTDGFVDTTAISDFCGTDDGFVVTWFDQSGNAVDATQGTPAEQPKIYDGTDGVIKDNGYPATEWSAASGQMLETTYTTNSSEFTVVAVANGDDNATNKTIVLTPEVLVFLGSDETPKHIQGDDVRRNYSSADFTDQAIHFIGNSGSESFAGENGDTLTTFSESTSTNSLLRIGNNSNGGIPFLGTIQEIVYYISDQSSSRTEIESNINDAFDVHPDADTTPESGFLSEFSGAAAAYSVRKLGDSPVAMRVRKTVSSVDYYQVIGFDANGDLDTAAIEEFGGSADVHVQTWYDQSGNGNHASNSTNAEQPKIYDGTDGIEKENGIPTIQFDGTDDYLKADGYIVELSQNSASVFVTANGGTPDVNTDYLLSEGDSSDPYSSNFIFGGGSSTGSAPVLWVNGTTFGTITTGQHVIGFDYDGTNFQAHLDGSTLGSSGTATVNSETSGGGTHIGTRADGTTAFYNGNAQEIITYKSDKSSDRSDIESNINNYFLVHQEASASPATGLLSEAPNAHTAISTRQLGDAVLCMKVNRDSDDATKNIGFKNGSLDTQAIIDFSKGGNVSVDTWYDQSGNDRHYTDPTGRTFTKADFDSTMPASISRFRIYDQQLDIMTIGNNFPAVSRGSGATALMANDCGDDKATMAFSIAELNPSNDTFFIQTDAFRFVTCQGTESNVQGEGTIVYVDGRDNSNTGDTYEKNKISQISVDVDSPGDSTYSSEPLLGARYSTGPLNSPNVDFCEFITYDTGDFDTIRAIVDTNQNRYYKAYKKFSTGLLDSYPGAAGAYSLRRLSSSYDGPLIEVEESHTGATHDIYARGNGELNTGEMYFIEAANTQNTLRVSKWYDQSGNGNDLIQATDGAQPIIKKASSDGSTHDGLIVTEGNKPAVEFDGTTDYLKTSSAVITDGDAAFVVVCQTSASDGNRGVVGAIDGGNDGYEVRYEGGSGRVLFAVNGDDLTEKVSNHFSVFANYDGSTQTLSVNGKPSTSSVSETISTTSTLGIGSRSGDGLISDTYLWDGTIQEVLVYNSDQSSNRTPIEKNLNTHYSIYDQPLLDVVEDAAAAYSLRKLRAGYTGPAINVYNGTDYKDIYFRANGTLDTGAISRFCGSNDGTVAIWYDQSGGANHAEQTTPASRPKIYDNATGIVTDNGKPAVDCSYTTNISLSASSPTGFDNMDNFTLLMAANFTLLESTDYNFALVDTSGLDIILNNQDPTTFRAGAFPPGSGTITNASSVGSHLVFAGYGSNAQLAVDGSTTTGTINISSYGTSDVLYINRTGAGLNAKAKYHEIICYPSDQSANRTVAEANINHYYSIY